MKRLLFVVALIPVLLLALSGCDLLLEKIFGAGSIAVTVQIDTTRPAAVDWATAGIVGAELLQQTATLGYEPVQGTLRKLTFQMAASPWAETSYLYEALASGSYYVHIWYDMNLDGVDDDKVSSNYNGSGYWTIEHGLDPVVIAGRTHESASYSMSP